MNLNKWHVKIIWILNIQGTKFQDKDSKDKDKKDDKKEDKKSDDKKKDDDEKSGVWSNAIMQRYYDYIVIGISFFII